MIRFILSLSVAGFMLEGAKYMDLQPIAEKIIADTYTAYAAEQPVTDDLFTDHERASLSRYLELPQVTEIYPGIGRALDNQKTR